MKLYFSEQDIIDACCVFAAYKQHGHPEQFEVDLQFNREHGFSADVRSHFSHIWFQQQDIIDSIAFYLAEYHNFIPEHLRVDLVFVEGEGIEAEVLLAHLPTCNYINHT
jgi:hypothetical protein